MANRHFRRSGTDCVACGVRLAREPAHSGTRSIRSKRRSRNHQDTNEAIVFTPPRIAGYCSLRWTGRGVATIAAVGWLAAASAGAEVVPAPSQASGAAEVASPATAAGDSDIRNRIESATGLA